MLAWIFEALKNSPTPDAPEVPQINGVFLLAFLAENHLVTGSIGENTLYEIAAIGAVNFPQVKALCF